jgi:hypothetical protein
MTRVLQATAAVITWASAPVTYCCAQEHRALWWSVAVVAVQTMGRTSLRTARVAVSQPRGA